MSLTVAGPAQPIGQPAQRHAGRDQHPPRYRVGQPLQPDQRIVRSDIPGQHADFSSAPLSSPVDVVGSPTVQIRAASPNGEAVLFLKLYDVDPSGTAKLALRADHAGPADRPTGNHRRSRAGHRQPAGDRVPVRGGRPDPAHRGHLGPGVCHAGRPRPSTPSRCRRWRRGHPAAAGRRRRSPTRTCSGATPWSHSSGSSSSGSSWRCSWPAGAAGPTPRRSWPRSSPTPRWSSADCARSTATASWLCPRWTSLSSVDKSSACSAPTAPARPPRCGSCWA